jgi:hypothetical protein
VTIIPKDPFVREKLVVNRVRFAVDTNEVQFYGPGNSPDVYPRVVIDSRGLRISPASDDEIREFISRKVFGLGFKQGNKDTRVWILDPWDVEYLAASPSAFLQAAETLEARKEIVLHDREYASAGEALLMRGEPLGALTDKMDRALEPGEATHDALMWDAFICHASEDKEKFVEPLARVLREHGRNVWYDKFVLKVGDSLREKIDEGLRASRYGIVVLSRAFFSKRWPKNELDGLVAKEMDGRKIILPVWHGVTKEEVHNFSPILSGRLAADSKDGIQIVVEQLLDAMG